MDADFATYLGRRGIDAQQYADASMAEKAKIVDAYERQRGKHFVLHAVVPKKFMYRYYH
jgi:hypothetical protein